MRQFLIFVGLLALGQAHSPVVMWPAKQFELRDGFSPLESLSAEKFGKMIANQKIVVFAKKGFSLETLSMAPKAPSYLDSQELAALQSVHNLHRLLKEMVKAKSIEYLVLEDDDIIKNDAVIAQHMQKYEGYAGMIVTTPIHKISARAAGDAPDKPACAIRGNKCAMVYIQSAKLNGTDATCTVTCNGDNETSGFELKLSAGGNEAIFNVTEEEGGYMIKSEEYRKLNTDVNWFPGTFSYSCGTFVATNPKTDVSVVLDTFQIFMTSDSTKKAFPDDTWDCSTWLTTPIVMGLVVVLFYLMILFGAVLFLLDIKANDRFDDPKGKTITVNISE